MTYGTGSGQRVRTEVSEAVLCGSAAQVLLWYQEREGWRGQAGRAERTCLRSLTGPWQS